MRLILKRRGKGERWMKYPKVKINDTKTLKIETWNVLALLQSGKLENTKNKSVKKGHIWYE